MIAWLEALATTQGVSSPPAAGSAPLTSGALSLACPAPAGTFNISERSFTLNRLTLLLGLVNNPVPAAQHGARNSTRHPVSHKGDQSMKVLAKEELIQGMADHPSDINPNLPAKVNFVFHSPDKKMVRFVSMWVIVGSPSVFRR
jgi:hypothetical protein